MKICLAVLFAASVVGAAPYQTEWTNNEIRNADNKTITDEALKNALEYAKMFLSQSYDIPKENYTYTNKDTFLNVSLWNATVGDPSDFNIEESHVDMNTLQFFINVSFPYLNISGDYYANVSLQQKLGIQLHDWGYGPFSLNTTNVAVSLILSLGQEENQTIYLKDVQIDYKVPYIKARFENIVNDTEITNITNDLINDFIVDSLEDFKTDLTTLLAQLVINNSSFLFNDVTLKQLVDFINSLGG